MKIFHQNQQEETFADKGMKTKLKIYVTLSIILCTIIASCASPHTCFERVSVWHADDIILYAANPTFSNMKAKHDDAGFSDTVYIKKCVFKKLFCTKLAIENEPYNTARNPALYIEINNNGYYIFQDGFCQSTEKFDDHPFINMKKLIEIEKIVGFYKYVRDIYEPNSPAKIKENTNDEKEYNPDKDGRKILILPK